MEEWVSICQTCRERIKCPPWPPKEHMEKNPGHNRFALVPKSMEHIN